MVWSAIGKDQDGWWRWDNLSLRLRKRWIFARYIQNAPSATFVWSSNFWTLLLIPQFSSRRYGTLQGLCSVLVHVHPPGRALIYCRSAPISWCIEYLKGLRLLLSTLQNPQSTYSFDRWCWNMPCWLNDILDKHAGFSSFNWRVDENFELEKDQTFQEIGW